MYAGAASSLERMPKKPLTTEQIAAAANDSKSGAGVFIVSHLKEIILCAASFLAGCLVMGTVLHFANPEPSETQATTMDMTDNDNNNDLDLDIDEQIAVANQTEVVEQTLSNTSSNVTNPTSHVARSTSQEPVVVRKIITKRDTFIQHENVVLKDTVYLFEKDE